MADKPAIFDEPTARELLEMVRDWRANGRRFEKAGLKTAKSDRGAPIVQALEITSATADSNGYPARIQLYNGTTWSDEYEVCRAVRIGGGTLQTGFYLGRLVRVTEDYHVYGVVEGFSAETTNYGVLFNVCPVFGLLSQDTDKTVRLDGVAIGTSGVDVIIDIIKETKLIALPNAVTVSDPICETAVEDECCPDGPCESPCAFDGSGPNYLPCVLNLRVDTVDPGPGSWVFNDAEVIELTYYATYNLDLGAGGIETNYDCWVGTFVSACDSKTYRCLWRANGVPSLACDGSEDTNPGWVLRIFSSDNEDPLFEPNLSWTSGQMGVDSGYTATPFAVDRDNGYQYSPDPWDCSGCVDPDCGSFTVNVYE